MGALDKDASMRVSWDDYSSVCKTLNRAAVPGVPKTVEQMASVWRALDEDCGGWIALREFDLEAFDCVAGFKQWAMKDHGAVVHAFHALSGRNQKLTESELPPLTDYKFKPHLFIQGLNLCNNVVVH